MIKAGLLSVPLSKKKNKNPGSLRKMLNIVWGKWSKLNWKIYSSSSVAFLSSPAQAEGQRTIFKASMQVKSFFSHPPLPLFTSFRSTLKSSTSLKIHFAGTQYVLFSSLFIKRLPSSLASFMDSCLANSSLNSPFSLMLLNSPIQLCIKNST